MSKGLSRQHQSLSIYDNELLALVMAMNKWYHYLIIRPFVIKTDRKDLKFLLEQKLRTGNQLKWITKVMQFDFEIEYKKVKENKVVDALSRLPSVELTTITITTVKNELLEMIKNSWETDTELKNLIQSLRGKGTNNKGYAFVHDQLRKNGKVIVGPNKQLIKEILQLWHSTLVCGYSGANNTYKKVSTLLYWKGMREEVHEMVKTSDICQRHKYDNAPYPGLLQPLKIHVVVWCSISMDFIEGLPKSKGNQ